MFSSLKLWLNDNGANTLTSVRIVIVFFLFVVLFDILYVDRIMVFIIAVIGALTDLFDGPVARRTRITVFGTMADPISDKFFTLAIGLLLWKWLPPEVASLIWWLNTIPLFSLNGINIFLLAVGIYAYLQGIRPKSNRMGQLKMGSDCITLAVWWVFSQLYPVIEINKLVMTINILLVITIFFAIGSVRGHWKQHYHKLNLPRQLFWLQALARKLACIF